MGLFIRQNENRSKLQERLAAELREKAKLQANAAEPIDQTKDSYYVKDSAEVSGKVWLWVLAGGILVAAAVTYIIVR